MITSLSSILKNLRRKKVIFQYALLEIPTVAATPESTMDFTWLFIKMLLVLGIVTVAAILILKYAVPRIGIMKRFQRGRHFDVLGRHVLEPGKSLYLVKTGGRYLVIGAAESGINLLTELEEHDATKDNP